MSTSDNAPIAADQAQRDMRVAVVRTLWNSHITGALLQGALDTLAGAGIEDEMVDVFEVPGAVELTFAASQLIETGLYDSVIVLGCVVRGGTPHFDYVCQSVTQGITHLNSECDIPVIFGVLTVAATRARKLPKPHFTCSISWIGSRISECRQDDNFATHPLVRLLLFHKH